MSHSLADLGAVKLPDLPHRLQAARRAAGLTQAEVARQLGVHPMSVSSWERGVMTPEESKLARLAELYGVAPASLRYGGEHAPVERPEHVPSLALRKRLPTRAYDLVLGYLHRMEEAGCTQEQIDEAERVMIDGAYNKLNKRDFRERSEDDIITDIRAAWDFIAHVLRRQGVPL
jgi:transcriptional regulator with XRE-family HTH domain